MIKDLYPTYIKNSQNAIKSPTTTQSDNWFESILHQRRHFLFVLIAQSCPTLRDPMDYSPPGSSVHGILQAKILQWVAIPFFRGSAQPRDWTWVYRIADRFFTIWATRKPSWHIDGKKYTKRCSASLIISEMQIKIRYHCMPLRMAKIERTGQTK